jgi:predicted MPP superfamily phosphohydrolase
MTVILPGMSVFFTSVLLLLLGTHYFIYRSFLSACDGAQRRVRAVLILTLTLLVLSIPIARLLHALYGNGITRAVLVFSSFWVGLAIHLALFLMLAWATRGVSRLVSRPLSIRWVVSIAAGLALFSSTYGLWNALHPSVTPLEVEIAELPERWEGRTVVQLSDVHLGGVHGRSFLRRVVEMTNAVDPEAVFITGDLFSGSCSELDRFGDLLDGLRTRHGVFFVTGNHEGYAGLEVPLAFLRRTKIRVLDDECAELDGLQVVGISYPWFSRQPDSENPFDARGCYTPDKPSILLYHTPTDVRESYVDRGTQQLSSYFAPDTDFSLAVEAGVDLQLSGHTHAGQMLPFGLLTRFLWNGFDRGLHRIGDFTLHVSSGAGTWGPPVRTGSRGEVVSITLRGGADRDSAVVTAGGRSR